MSLPEYKRIHAEADRFEPRLERSVITFAQRLRKKVRIGDLEAALRNRSVRDAAEWIAELPIEDTLEPSAEILGDAFFKGGAIASKELRDGD